MKKILLAVSFLIIFQTTAFTQNLSDYLITNDIGSYRKLTSGGTTDSILAGVGHFYPDHNDSTLGIVYVNDSQKLWIDVNVTQHTGGDSDRWLLHEVEDSYRDPDNEDGRLGLLLQATRLREFNGNKVVGRRGNGYTWVSNNIVIDISYTDLKGNKPEPLEVVQAYLVKFPSTIITTPIEFKGETYNKKWIKDEMDRRLWLCDKWNAQFQAGQTNQNDLIYNLDSNINVFLNYRQKYYGIASENDIITLRAYIRANDLTSIQTKLTEYKTWWNANKGKGITLP